MGVTVLNSTTCGGYTAICNHCGIALCWDISDYDYLKDQEFWDQWICCKCNGKPMSLKEWRNGRS